MADWAWPGTFITRVLDGDTVEATVCRDIGFEGKVSFPIRVRLNRIDAYKVATDLGFRGKARVLAVTAGLAVHVTTMRGYKYGAPPEKTGEWMAEVVLPDGRNLSDLLVADGLAVYWDGAGPRPAV